MSYPVVVLAGGLGTRVRHLTGDVIPKAMLEVAGRPFIDFKLASLMEAGATRVIVSMGHHGERLRRHLEEFEWDLDVTCVSDGATLQGTGGAVRGILHHLPSCFWVTYGDTLLEVPLEKVEYTFARSSSDACMTVLRNFDRWETSNVDVDGEFVVRYEKGAKAGTVPFIDYGMLLFRKRAFDRVPEGAFDLALVLERLIGQRRLLAYEVENRFYDVGNEVGLAATEEFVLQRGSWMGLREGDDSL